MPFFARAFPVHSGMEDAAHKFVAEVSGPRRAEAVRFLERNGVTRETWHLQRLGAGTILIVCTDFEKRRVSLVEASPAEQAFDSWIVEQVRRLSGLDLREKRKGPQAETVFSWERW